MVFRENIHHGRLIINWNDWNSWKEIVSRFIEAKQPAVYVSEMNTVYILKVGFWRQN
jgi:hypothetical protein